MLDAVTKGFRAAKHKLTGKAELTEANIDDALRDIRVALLEADVEFNVAKRFLARVKEKAVGEVVATAVTDKKGKKMQVAPGDHFIKICHDELDALMGPVDTSLALTQKGERPAGIGKDHHRRQAGEPAPEARQEAPAGGGGHLPAGRRRPAQAARAAPGDP